MEIAQTQQQMARRRRRFSVHEYHRMAEAGILHEDDRVELIDGEIVEMNPIGRRHQSCVDRLTELLVEFAGRNYLVRIQGPIGLDESDELQPDVSVLKRRADFYSESHPNPEDVMLVIEVSDTSLTYDRGVKLPLYARAGILEVFIVDLAGQAIERHNEPSGTGYRRMERARRRETLGSETLPALVVPVDAVPG